MPEYIASYARRKLGIDGLRKFMQKHTHTTHAKRRSQSDEEYYAEVVRDYDPSENSRGNYEMTSCSLLPQGQCLVSDPRMLEKFCGRRAQFVIKFERKLQEALRL